MIREILYIATGIIGLVYTYAEYKKNQRLHFIPISKIRGAAMGYVQIQGTAIAEELQTSKFFKKKCIHCKYKVTATTVKGIQTIYQGVQGRYIYVGDETGNVLVDLQQCNIEQEPKRRQQELALMPANIHDEIRKASSVGEHKTLLIEEQYIDDASKILIQGTAADNPFVEDGSQMHGHKDVMIHANHIHAKNKEQATQNLQAKVLAALVSSLIFLLYGVVVLLRL